MKRLSKRTKKFVEIVGAKKSYSLEEAVEQITKAPAVKFNETVELHFHLGIDTEASDQGVRGTVVLPHGTGRKVRIAVFCKGELVAKAETLGADFVGSDKLIEKVSGGFMDFDCVIATPDMMRELSKLGKILGPRGLMPSPKAGTVTMDIERAITEVRAGRIEFKTDKQAGIHVGIGKRSFSKQQLVENARQLIQAINTGKPAAVKGAFFKSVYLSTTMGPGLPVNV